ncbi:MAG: hypothetical protein WCT77_05965, partial [Bacteroidota bacterium]
MKKFLLVVIFLASAYTYTNAQWQEINNGFDGGFIFSIETYGNNIYTTTNEGIYLSVDNCNTWRKENFGLNDKVITRLVKRENDIFVTTSDNELYLSTDIGKTWTKEGQVGDYRALTVSGNNLFALNSNNNIFMSSDNGETWVQKNNGLNLNWRTSIVACGNNIFIYDYRSIYRSTNNGDSWVEIKKGLINDYVETLKTDGNFLLTQDGKYFTYISTDYGDNWILKDSTVKKHVNCILSKSNFTIAGTESGIYIVTESGATWTKKNNELSGVCIWTLNEYGNSILAGTQLGFFISTNNGETWTKKSQGLVKKQALSLLKKDNNIFAGTQAGYSQYSADVLLSSDNGETWIDKYNGIRDFFNVTTLVTFGNKIYAGGEGAFSIFSSTNNGETWNAFGFTGTCFIVFGAKDSIFIINDEHGIELTTNNGKTWIYDRYPPHEYYSPTSFCINDTNIFAATSNGVFLSTDYCNTWIPKNNG